MSHRKVFEDVVNNALRMPDDNQAINFACTQLECMYQFTSSKSEVKSMCGLAVDKFYHSKRFRGNDHVLRIFQVLIRVSQTMGASGIYSKVDSEGYFRKSLKFYVLWGEAEATQKNSAKFKEIWTQAREEIPSKNLDAAFRDIASSEFPEISSWFDDDDHEKTLNIFAPSTKSRRRSSVAFLERAALPAPSAPSIKTTLFMSKKNPLRTCIVDREDGYLGISLEEYRVAKTEDLADMEITMMQPIEEEPEMDVVTEKKEEGENGESKKMRMYSPIRQPLIPKQDMKVPSPLVAHTSFTSNFYNKAMNAFSETMKVEEGVNSPMDKQSDATYDVERTPSSTAVTSSTCPSASRESFAIFVDEDEVKEEEHVPLPPPITRPRGLSARPSVTSSLPPPPVIYEDDPFDDNEPTVAGFNRGKGDRFLTSTPAVKGFEMENAEPNFWQERGSGEGLRLELEDLNLSAIDEGEKEGKEGKTPSDTVVSSSAGSAFGRKRKSFGGVVGDKARSSLGPKGGSVGSEKDVEKGILVIGEEKINPWDREIRGAIMSRCGTPVNRHDLPGSIKQPKNGQKMELGGEMYSLEHLIGEGGFAKVFLCANEKKDMLAMKYETPSCEWEVYILEALRKRVRNETVMESLMQVTDAFIYSNCSLILSEYLPLGTLLQSTTTNTDPHWSIVVYLGMQMAKVLKDVHSANIVHADAKPDNWMVMEKIDEDASIEELMNSRTLRLIDWGRAIDMKALGGRPLHGRAGTDKFDCIEMTEGRPWTYHPDYFAFCATIYVVHMKEYMAVGRGANGRYAPVKMFKRRVATLPLWTDIFDECFNIVDGSSLPSWSLIHDKLKGYLIENVDKSAWKDAVRKFNKSLQTS